MKAKGIIKALTYISAGIAIIAFLAVLPGLVERISIRVWEAKNKNIKIGQEEFLKDSTLLAKEIVRFDKIISTKTPRSNYLIVNTSANEFYLYKGTTLVKTDKCSTGSYILLKNDNQEEWLFKTPRGEFHIQGKTASPVWRKPDWAFVEEGLPVPPKNHYTRFEYGVLGDYALSFGQGYLIHGTLYQRFLGLPVTHGCIRLNDDNLELIYNSLSLGSKLFIY